MDRPTIALLTRASATVLLALAAGSAGAQVYRIVGPDGRVTFSDRPPAEANARPAAAASAPSARAGSGSELPFELRQIVQRYPVTLITGADCAPCTTGRNYLAGRGIPYTEKTVSTTQDAAALQRLSGGASLPTLTIGGQVLSGFSESEWAQYLQAAGYPANSQLPAGWRAPAPTPLVAVAPPAPAPRPVEPTAPAAVPPPPAPAALPPGNNPAGIQF